MSKIIVVAGPTAVGKTEYAIEIVFMSSWKTCIYKNYKIRYGKEI